MEWLKNEDRNIKYFHYKATSRGKKSEILGLEDKEGHWREDIKEIKKVVYNYFSEIFSSSNPQLSDIDKVLNCIDGRITGSMREYLLSPYSVEEVKRAIFNWGSTKAPGPDGFHAIFFQKNWSVLGHEISRVCIGILEGKHSIRSFNSTNIALIPKVAAPRKMADF